MAGGEAELETADAIENDGGVLRPEVIVTSPFTSLNSLPLDSCPPIIFTLSCS